MRNSKSPPTWKDRMFSVGCLGFGILGTLGIGVGVLTCIEALHPGFPVVAAQTEDSIAQVASPLDSSLPVDLNDPNVRIHYDENGRMVVDVYLTKEPVTDVDVNIHDGNNGDTDTENPEADKPDDPVTEDSGDSGESGDGGDPGESDDPTGTENPEGDAEVQNPDQSETSPATGEFTPSAGMTDEERAFLESAGGKYLDTDTVYTIQPGDTLTKISGMTGFSVDFLAEYNHIADKNLIIAYASLRYPTL